VGGFIKGTEIIENSCFKIKRGAEMFKELKSADAGRVFTTMFNRIVLLFVSFFILAIIPPTVAAEEATQEEGWKFGAEIYLWGAGIGGTTASGGDIDIEFSDIIDNLDMTFMGVLGARKGKWSILTDILYLDVEADNQGTLTVPIGPGFAVGTDASVGVKTWIVTPTVGYTVVETERARLDILGGARYLYLKSDINVNISGPLETRRERFIASDNVWDVIVGVKGRVNLSEKWYLPYYLDIGTGDTDLTWQAAGGVGYKFSKVDVVLGYRYLDWDFDDSDVFDDMNISGPYLGVKFVF